MRSRRITPRSFHSADAAREYDRLTKLDAWKTTVLLKIREGITEPSLT